MKLTGAHLLLAVIVIIACMSLIIVCLTGLSGGFQ